MAIQENQQQQQQQQQLGGEWSQGAAVTTWQ